ncbi:MAG: heat-inducible transcription repressor HrcA [Clostridiales bacterium]|nr:heat-inducible transcription repressor HrcA [Clostridiales bacterium]
MKLDDRKFMILQAIIDDYIMTAIPVGSRTIARKSGVGFSPATIRNEMSDLEELGYLDQPHASAGRVPSAKAYRLYVDRLMKVDSLTREDTERIHGHLSSRTSQVEQIIRHAAQAMSEITQYAAVVAAPEADAARIRHVQLVPVTETTAMMVVVLDGGLVKDALIRVPDGVAPDHLYGISKMMTEQLAGHTPAEARQRFAALFSGLSQHSRLMADVLGALARQLEGDNGAPLAVGGRVNVLNYPEYSDMEKARGFLALLESREKLYPLLRTPGGVEFTVRIGPENMQPEFRDISVVTASYRIRDGMHGTMGVIGPTRMNYARVVSVMNYVGKLIGDMLAGDEPKSPNQ